jgi:hypothetical protein
MPISLKPGIDGFEIFFFVHNNKSVTIGETLKDRADKESKNDWGMHIKYTYENEK